ncbi:CopG family transcriptional regulator [Candidatus Micrarchaeota archaeon]|nr:CopG family transcriptional regulator [Candidatus Micrarchaeota archaeon]
MELVSISLPEKIVKLLDKESERIGLSRSELIRSCVLQKYAEGSA